MFTKMHSWKRGNEETGASLFRIETRAMRYLQKRIYDRNQNKGHDITILNNKPRPLFFEIKTFYWDFKKC